MTRGSRTQLRNPLDMSKNGREPKKGRLGGPGGRRLFLLKIFLIAKRMRRKTMRREARSIAVDLLQRTKCADVHKCPKLDLNEKILKWTLKIYNTKKVIELFQFQKKMSGAKSAPD